MSNFIKGASKYFDEKDTNKLEEIEAHRTL